MQKELYLTWTTQSSKHKGNGKTDGESWSWLNSLSLKHTSLQFLDSRSVSINSGAPSLKMNKPWPDPGVVNNYIPKDLKWHIVRHPGLIPSKSPIQVQNPNHHRPFHAYPHLGVTRPWQRVLNDNVMLFLTGIQHCSCAKKAFSRMHSLSCSTR